MQKTGKCGKQEYRQTSIWSLIKYVWFPSQATWKKYYFLKPEDAETVHGC